MRQLGKVLTNTTWAHASDTINRNNDRIYEALLQVEQATVKHKGYFLSSEELNEAYPTPSNGWTAYVYNDANNAEYPYDIYQAYYDEDTSMWIWRDTGRDAPFPTVDVDTITQDLDNLDQRVTENENAIIEANQNIADLPSIRNSVDVLKAPIAPLYSTPNGNLHLRIGSGLAVQNNILCATGEGGGEGGTIYSEGSGISIDTDTNTISVLTDTTRGITVGGEGVMIKLSTNQLGEDTSGLCFNARGALQLCIGTGVAIDKGRVFIDITAIANV